MPAFLTEVSFNQECLEDDQIRRATEAAGLLKFGSIEPLPHTPSSSHAQHGYLDELVYMDDAILAALSRTSGRGFSCRKKQSAAKFKAIKRRANAEASVRLHLRTKSP